MPPDRPRTRSPSASSALGVVRGGRAPLRIGLLRLTDAAPVIAAAEFGFFADEGLDVQLSVEPSWANIADKLTFGLLDGGVVLPPLALAIHLGLRGAAVPLLVPMSLSLNGDTVTFSRELAGRLPASGGALAAARAFREIALDRSEPKLRLAVVHPFSTHNLLLRYWLAAGGTEPDARLALDVVPPSRMVDALGAGRIDGFCAGPPWGTVAERAGVGRTVAPSSAIWSRHPEKALAVRAGWAEAEPLTLAALLRALLRAARFCDAPENAPALAQLLSQTRYVGVDAEAIRPFLPGGPDGLPSIFFASAATFPWRSHARWFLRQMARWGYLPPDVDETATAGAVYRPDLYRAAAADIGVPAPLDNEKIEGGRAAEWRLPAARAEIAMGADRFCDDAVFDPQSPSLSVNRKEFA